MEKKTIDSDEKLRQAFKKWARLNFGNQGDTLCNLPIQKPQKMVMEKSGQQLLWVKQRDSRQG